MFSLINYSWRLFATGFSFAIFAIGGICIVFFLSAYFYITPVSKLRKHKVSRQWISRSFRVYLGMMRFMGLMNYDVSGGAKLGMPGQLVIANHPSLLDVVFLISLIENANCVVKGNLRNSWLTRWPVIASNYIAGDSDDLLEECCKVLAKGESLIIFPEGTRTEPGHKPAFLRGASYIALMSNCQLTPVLITCYPPTLLKGEKWYQVPSIPPHFSVEVLDDVDVNAVCHSDEHRRDRVRSLNASLQDIYAKSLGF